MTGPNRRGAWTAQLSRIAVVALAVLAWPGTPEAQPTEPSPTDTMPQFMVVGVVIPDRGIALAAIEDRAAMRTSFYRVGDSMVNGGVVTAIAPDRVTIAFGNELVLFRLAGAAVTLEQRLPKARVERSAARLVTDSSRRLDGASSPYGSIGAIKPVYPSSRPSNNTRGDNTGGTTGGGPTAGATSAPVVGVGSNATTVQFTGVLHGGSEQTGEQFSAQTLRDLLISVTHTNLSATRQRIELATPEGALYQKFSGDAAPASQLRVPIGGTWVTEHGLFGTWSVRVYLDRDTMPAASGTFSLSQ